MSLFQNRYIYYPPKGQKFEACPAFRTAEQVHVQGTRFYYKKHSDTLVVFYHGNAGSACDRAFLAGLFERLGLSYLFVEYTGYGGDGLRPSTGRLFADVVHVNEFLRPLDYKVLILAGESIGTGAAQYHTTLTRADKLLLVAPFPTLARVARRHFPFAIYPVSLLLQKDFDNPSWLSKFKGELMIIHGSKDTVIPIALGRKLFDAASAARGEFVEIENAGHNDIYDNHTTEERMEKFLRIEG
ncbi:MAG: alpha/beta hydrolase [bacterium]|nr:alpha/beta hydrolase [bacterium]MDZ4284764.1 alpha/beta hydrolase [Patescibacteria group bacterium]